MVLLFFAHRAEINVSDNGRVEGNNSMIGGILW